jgi:hypothetical protein
MAKQAKQNVDRSLGCQLQFGSAYKRTFEIELQSSSTKSSHRASHARAINSRCFI